MLLRTCYAMPGTDLASGCLHVCNARYRLVRRSAYARATGCPVLRERRVHAGNGVRPPHHGTQVSYRLERGQLPVLGPDRSICYDLAVQPVLVSSLFSPVDILCRGWY
eukprot:2636015-Rhodomonas_salina.2